MIALITALISSVLTFLSVSPLTPVIGEFFPEIIKNLFFIIMLGSVVAATAPKASFWIKVSVPIGVLLIALPIIGLTNTFYLNVAVDIGIYSALALGLNIVVGFAGLLDLGYIAFFATGAYLWGIFGSSQFTSVVTGMTALPHDLFFIFIPLALIVAALVGIMLGLPVLKVKGDYLAIITLGLGEVIRILANNNPGGLTNGAQGITAIGVPLESFANSLAFTGIQGFKWQLLVFYLIVILIILLAIVATQNLNNSKIGRAWVAIREDEVAAQAMGVPLVRTKLIAFATGASFAGAMGVVYAAKQTFISPESFDINQSIGIVAMVVLGGLGSIRGALTGALIVKSLEVIFLPALGNFFNTLRSTGALNLPSQFEVTKYQRLIFGVILILMMIFRPQGLIPAERNIIQRKRSIAPDPKGVQP